MKKQLPFVSMSFIILTLFISIVSCGKSNEKEIAASNYLNYCAGCHGFKLEKFVEKDWMYGNSNELLIESITKGRPDMGMPGFSKTFTEVEIKALAKYVKGGIPEELDASYSPQTSPINNSEEIIFFVDTVVSGLEIPWGLEFLPNGDLLIAERKGILYRFDGTKLHEIDGLPEIYVKGQGGLMDLKLHPNYAENGWLYISFSDPADTEGEEGGNTSILRTKLYGNKLVNVEKIFNGFPDTNKSYHFGCKLTFDKEGYLYFGIGDRGYREFNPQSLSNTNGKIHRIHDDGSIPSDNPFVNTTGAVPSIYSYGHRNPQGTDMHPETGQIWESEHGPRGGDELNLIKPGVNYGWPIISYGINYDGTTFTDLKEKDGMEQAVKYWVPSIAPCGMTFVTGEIFPEWKNNILIGSLKFQNMERLVLENGEVIHREILLDKIGRVRNVKMSPDGYVYVAIENPGKIVRLLPYTEE
ncbi:MAG: PQQ-dependent sugar dehydrogenase [Prolixibacteraceae bacterium]|jgi:glucose/arabinose dehydrogenase|nr:PQQ-dependent sugar dehydrogenase [Prolixibacteraceae bacterium]